MAGKYNLVLHRYCEEDNSYIVWGKLDDKINLNKLNKILKERSFETCFVKKLKTLTVILKNETVHIRSNGALAVHGVKTLKKAQSILDKIL